MKSLTSATIKGFGWSAIEPEEGKYTFEWLDELKEFESLTNKSFHSLSDVSKASSSFERIIDYYKQLEKYSKEITGMDKEKFFSDSVVSNITKANKALQTYYKDILFLILRLHFSLMQYPNRILLQNSSASFQVV